MCLKIHLPFHDIHNLLLCAAFFFVQKQRGMSIPFGHTPSFSLLQVQSCLPQTKLFQVQFFMKPSVFRVFGMKQGRK